MRPGLARAAAVALSLVPALAAAGERPSLAVAAASSLRPALEELARAFEGEGGGAAVAPTFGASGALFAQLREGAPFDLFLSADREYPRQVVLAGLGHEEVVYARGRLVVWLPAGSRVDVEGKGLRALADPSVRRIAIANPGIAPYGRAAEAALRTAGVWDLVRERLVLGQSVAQAAQFAHAGAVDAALVPASLARLPALAAAGRAVPLDAPPVEHSAVVLAGARHPDLARAFLAFVLGERGRAVLARHGYDPP